MTIFDDLEDTTIEQDFKEDLNYIYTVYKQYKYIDVYYQNSQAVLMYRKNLYINNTRYVVKFASRVFKYDNYPKTLKPYNILTKIGVINKRAEYLSLHDIIDTDYDNILISVLSAMSIIDDYNSKYSEGFLKAMLNDRNFK